MKKIYILFLIFFLSLFFASLARAENIAGRILLQVEQNGEAWYVYPVNNLRYYLGRPGDAFYVMQKLGLGASHDYILKTEIFPERLSGKILLDVEENGEAYYIFPGDLKKYYLGRPSDAFRIMREKGLGITDFDLNKFFVGDINILSFEETEFIKIIQDVSFIAQAPFGNWSDQRQQDGCEESSALMAMKWAKGESLTKEKGLQEILAISDFEQEKYGEYRDISAENVVEWIFNDYFKYNKVLFSENVLLDDIIQEIKSGNLVITPMNGQLLGNPYFTSPGPIRHMLLIKGYDSVKNVFITNDPGTRHGDDFEYNTQVLYNSIRDYPTGYHESIESVEKNIIIISK